jgi:ABC-type branched-subunit amino acid transport system substrate-binding protein
VPYADTEKDFTAHVQKLRSSGATAVWLHDTPPQTAGVIGVSAQLGYNPLYVGVSPSYATYLARTFGAKLANFRLVSSNVNYGDPVPEMTRMIDVIKQSFPAQKPDNYLVTGWISGIVAKAALDRACAKHDLTRAGINAAMAGMTVDLHGMGPNLAFGAGQVPARANRINDINLENGFPRAVSDWITSDPAKSWTLKDAK